MKTVQKSAKIIFGNLIIAFAVNMFILPFSFISGGSTGLALIIRHFTNWNFSYIISVINVTMFFLGLLFLGKKFAMSTLLSTCIYPLLLQLTAAVSEHFVLTLSPLAASLAGGVLTGLGLGLVIQAGASTGGMDIPPLILNRRFHLNISLCMYLMDTAILLAQLTFCSREGALCGFILVFSTSFVMNLILFRKKEKAKTASSAKPLTY